MSRVDIQTDGDSGLATFRGSLCLVDEMAGRLIEAITREGWDKPQAIARQGHGQPNEEHNEQNCSKDGLMLSSSNRS